MFNKSCRNHLDPSQRSSLSDLIIHNLSLLDITNPIDICISIEPDTDQTWLARFKVNKSNNRKFFIALNDCWLAEYTPSNKNKASIVNRILMHELIHGLDLLTIKDSLRKHQTNCHSVKLLIRDEKVEFYWVLMYYFTLLRDEGLALYGEELFYGPSDAFTDAELEAMLMRDVDWMLTCMEKNNAIHAELDQLFTRVYDYGAYVYKLLFQDETQAKTPAAHLMELMQMDVSHWIWLFFSRIIPHQAHRLLSYYSLDNIPWFVNHGSPVVNAKLLLMSFFRVRGINPSGIELDRLWDSIEMYEHDLHFLVHDRIKSLWVHIEPELQPYVLSYLIKSKDQLHDELTFIGHLDDMFLLEFIEENLIVKSQ